MRKLIFEHIYIVEGLYHRKIEFNKSDNLITSKGENSTGKTTLIRFLLYGLGYPIPSTKGIKFESCYVEVQLNINNQLLLITRNNDDVTIHTEGLEEYYVVPQELHKIQIKLFGEKSFDVLDNLLGAFYIDQDRGWTLLNRGKVVGSIPFNIEKLIRGLSDRSCKLLEIELSQVEKEISKYNQVLKIGEYQEQYLQEETFLLPNDNNSLQDKRNMEMKIRQQQLRNELKRVEEIVKKNINFKKYIENMYLMVKSSTGEEVQVTENTLVDFKDNLEIQKVRAKMLVRELALVEEKLEILEENILHEELIKDTYKTSLFEMGQLSVLDKFDAKISSVPINITQVKETIKQLHISRLGKQQEIQEKTMVNNEVVEYLNKQIFSYAKELQVETYIMKNGVFTSKLKALSGAIYHKIVFSFRLAYINAIEKFAGLNLPIIIDSPSGREMNQENIDDTMFILKRDFSHHQIIIVSIYQYEAFDNARKIFIIGNLVNEVKGEGSV